MQVTLDNANSENKKSTSNILTGMLNPQVHNVAIFEKLSKPTNPTISNTVCKMAKASQNLYRSHKYLYPSYITVHKIHPPTMLPKLTMDQRIYSTTWQWLGLNG